MVKNNETTEKQNEQHKTTIQDTDTWISRTKSGNGFIIVLDDNMESGDCLTGSIEGLEKFLKGSYKGIKLGVLVAKE